MINFYKWLQETNDYSLGNEFADDDVLFRFEDENNFSLNFEDEEDNNSQNQNQPQQQKPQSTSLSDLLKFNNQQKEYFQKNFTIVPDQNKIIIQHKQSGGKAEIAKIHMNDPMKMQEFKSEVIALMNPQQQSNQQSNTFQLGKLGIKAGEFEVIKFPEQNKIGVRNRKIGSPGHGSIHYFNTKSGDINKFSQELRKSFGT
jgi:hypothetical protein